MKRLNVFVCGLRGHVLPGLTVLCFTLLMGLLTPPSARAQDGFSIRHEAVVEAAPAAVYEMLVDNVGRWWSPSHTYSGDAANLSIDARPGGCFCERW
ncbi:MAG: hypothetical protein WD205_06975, partial [Rhodothermales bacterium]